MSTITLDISNDSAIERGIDMLKRLLGRAETATTAAQPAKTPAAPKPEQPKASAAPSPTPAPISAPASAPAAAGGSESNAGDEKRPTYDDVKARVLALTKVSRETCVAALAKFGVDHGTKLKLEDYPAFLAHADELLKAAAK